MPRTGRPPVPAERKRARGNPGKRALPAKAEVVALPAAAGVPEPERELGPVGLALWGRVWANGSRWISPATDLDLVLVVCEQLDEREALRRALMDPPDEPDDPKDRWKALALVVDMRRQLRDLEKAIVGNLSLLGFTPTDRARLGVAEVKAATMLQQLQSGRSGGA